MSREDLIRSLFDKSARGLEIGPSYNPIAARRLGYHVDVLDHTSTEGLRSKYANEPNIDVGLIEEVDFVWTDGSLCETVGAVASYDYIVASHVIEHTPDFLGFLNQCSALLKSDGRIVLAVPDKRRCFDACRPLTSLGEILQAHHEGRTRHTPATAFDHVAYMVTLDGRSGWARGADGCVAMANDLGFAKAVYERSLSDPAYHDFHAWVFTPSSFRLIMSDLAAIGETDLREADFRLTDGFEFLTVLSKTGGRDVPTRTELSRSILRELSEYPAEVRS